MIAAASSACFLLSISISTLSLISRSSSSASARERCGCRPLSEDSSKIPPKEKKKRAASQYLANGINPRVTYPHKLSAYDFKKHCPVTKHHNTSATSNHIKMERNKLRHTPLKVFGFPHTHSLTPTIVTTNNKSKELVVKNVMLYLNLRDKELSV